MSKPRLHGLASLPKGSMYWSSIYLGLKVAPISLLWGLCIYYIGTWTLQANQESPVRVPVWNSGSNHMGDGFWDLTPQWHSSWTFWVISPLFVCQRAVCILLFLGTYMVSICVSSQTENPKPESCHEVLGFKPGPLIWALTLYILVDVGLQVRAFIGMWDIMGI